MTLRIGDNPPEVLKEISGERSIKLARQSGWVLLPLLTMTVPQHSGHATAIADVHDFNPGDSGAFAAGRLYQAADGSYYGTTLSGGVDGEGTFFGTGIGSLTVTCGSILSYLYYTIDSLSTSVH